MRDMIKIEILEITKPWSCCEKIKFNLISDQEVFLTPNEWRTEEQCKVHNHKKNNALAELFSIGQYFAVDTDIKEIRNTEGGGRLYVYSGCSMCDSSG